MIRNRRSIASLIVFSAVCGTLFANVMCRRHAIPVESSQTRTVLLKAEKTLNQSYKDSSPENAANDLDRKYRIYKQGRYLDGISKINASVDSKTTCWLPLTAIAGKIEGGSWFLELTWLDADSKAKGVELENDDGLIGQIHWHTLNTNEQNVYNSTAIHYASFDLQEQEGPITLIRDYVWPNKGLIAIPLSVFLKHPRLALISGDGVTSDWISIHYTKPAVTNP